ncbi:MAG: DUF3788 domain-containing protein [Clostridiales bacterium]|nr:DUF3788 domain-containing protein [Clostridiales bacterium]
MSWSAQFPADRQPAPAEISAYISSPLWDNLNTFLAEGYAVTPDYAYSTCSMQAGWNIKYKKAGRALCTLYPMEGFFIAMVVIGAKEMGEAELLLPALDPYTQALYERTSQGIGQKWLMINVTSEPILNDVKALIQIRRKIKK